MKLLVANGFNGYEETNPGTEKKTEPLNPLLFGEKSASVLFLSLCED